MACMLKPKEAWWTRGGGWERCGVHAMLTTGRGAGWWRYRGNGYPGTVWPHQAHRGTGPGHPTTTISGPCFSVFHEISGKHHFSSLSGHRTDDYVPHRHVWLYCDLIWKWPTLFDPVRTEVHGWSTDEVFQWGKVFKSGYPSGCLNPCLINDKTVTSDWPASWFNIILTKPPLWHEICCTLENRGDSFVHLSH